MTVPNGAAGINTAGGLFLTSAHGHGDLSASQLVGNDEDTVKAAYQAKFVDNGNSVWSDPASPLAQIFGGNAGIPGTLAALIGKLFNIDTTGVSNVHDLLVVIPVLGDIIKALDQGWQDILDGLNSITSGPSFGSFFNDVITDLEDWWNDTQATAGQASDAQTAVNQAVANLLSLFGVHLDVPTGSFNPSTLAVPSNSLSGLLAQAQVSGLTNLATMLNQISDILNGAVVTPINAAVQGVKDWFNGLLGFQSTSQQQQTNLQNFQISALTAGANRNPLWVCRYPIGDVSYPEFFNSTYEVFGTTDGASAGTAHTHTLSTAGNNASAQVAGWAIAQNASRGAYITISNSTIMDTVGFVGWRDTGTAVNNVFFEMFRENPDGSLVQLVSQDVSSMFTPTSTYQELSIPSQIVAAAERYMLRIRNASTVATPVRVRAVRRTAGTVNPGFLTTTASNSNQTSYTAAQASTFNGAATFVDWWMLAAKNLVTTDQSFSDDFNRSALGGLWSTLSSTSSQLGIYQQKASYTGSTDGNQNAIFVRPTSGDGMRADIAVSATALAITGARGGPLVNCARDFSQVVFLGVNANSAKIYSGPWNSLTERASISSGGDGIWAIYYDQANNKYVVLLNGSTTGLEWPDTGNLMQHGRDYRYGGLRMSRATFVNSAPMDNWTLRDFAP